MTAVAVAAGALVVLSSPGFAGGVATPRLGTAANYAVIGGSTITSVPPTVINGNLALSPGSSVTGGPTVTGSSDVNNAAAIQAQTDLTTAYTDAASATPCEDLTGQDLGNMTLTPGVYCFSSSAQLTGVLTLDGEGATNPTFIFRIGSTLTTASASSVVLINGASGCGLFWQVGSSATLGSTTAFQGNLMTLASITMDSGATIGVGGGTNGGRAMARTEGAVTLNNNIITPPPPGCTFTAAPASPSPVDASPAGAGSSSPATNASDGPSTIPNTSVMAGSSPDGVPWIAVAVSSAIAMAGTVSLAQRPLRAALARRADR